MQEIEKSPCSTMDMYDPLRYRLCIIVFKSYSLSSLSRAGKSGETSRPTIDHSSFSKSNRVLSAQPESTQRKLIPRARSSRKIPLLLPFGYTEQNEQILRHDSDD